MLTDNKTLIAKEHGTGWNRDERIEVHKEKDVPFPYTVFELTDKTSRKTVQTRWTDRKDSTIQISIQEYKFSTNRTKMLSFSLPKSLYDIFIQSISKK